MVSNPVENNVVTRFILGIAVIVGMFLGGGAVGSLFSSLDFPYATSVGVFLGSLAVFLAFTAWYTRYDRSFGAG